MPELLALLIPAENPPGTELQDALVEAQGLLAAARPDLLVTIDAGWRPKAFAVGAGQVTADEARQYRAPGAPAFATVLIDTAIGYGLPSFAEEAPLTPEVAAVLAALWPAGDVPVLPLGVATASPSLLQEFGQAIAAAGRTLGQRVVALCVGAIARDHQAEHDGRENAAVRRFGELVLERMERSGGEELFDIDGALWVQAHPETDLCHLALLLGATGIDPHCQVLGRHAGPGTFAATVALYRGDALPFGSDRGFSAADHPKPL